MRQNCRIIQMQYKQFNNNLGVIPAAAVKDRETLQRTFVENRVYNIIHNIYDTQVPAYNNYRSDSDVGFLSCATCNILQVPVYVSISLCIQVSQAQSNIVNRDSDYGVGVQLVSAAGPGRFPFANILQTLLRCNRIILCSIIINIIISIIIIITIIIIFTGALET